MYIIDKQFLWVLEEYCEEQARNYENSKGMPFFTAIAGLPMRAAKKILVKFKSYGPHFGMELSEAKYPGKLMEICSPGFYKQADLKFLFNGEVQTIEIDEEGAEILQALLEKNKHRLSTD